MSSVWIIQQRLKSVLENNVLVDGFWSVQPKNKSIRCDSFSHSKPPYPLVDLGMVGPAALRAESIVATTLDVDAQGRCSKKRKYIFNWVKNTPK